MELTENGAFTFDQINDDLVNAWFKLGRNSSYEEVEQLLMKCIPIDKLLMWKMICAFRNFREIGKGERELFVNALKVMSRHDHKNLILNMDVLKEQGRLDDFYKLGTYFLEKVKDNTIEEGEITVLEEIVKMYVIQFQSDKKAMEDKKRISLLAKWADHQKKGLGMTIVISYYLGLLEPSQKMISELFRPLITFKDVIEFLFKVMKLPTEKEDDQLIQTMVEKKFDDFTDSHMRIVKSVNYALSKFRKEYLSPLNKYLHTVEIEMCDKTFQLTPERIESMPALSVKKYQKYFEKKFPEQFMEITRQLILGKINLKGVSIDFGNFGKEYLQNESKLNPITEAQFETILEHTFSQVISNLQDGNEFVVSCPVSDISGSMMTKFKGVCPLNVCALLSILTMKLNILEHWSKYPDFSAKDWTDIVMGKKEFGEDVPFYATHGISFSETPQFYEIPFTCGSLFESVKLFMKQPIGYSTNFFSVFNLLKQLQIAESINVPKRVVAFTDGQFDSQSYDPLMTTIEAIRKLFDNIPPELVYWNIGVSPKHRTSDIRENLEGYSALSGYNPNLTQVILFNERKNGTIEKMNPKQILERILSHSAFERIIITYN